MSKRARSPSPEEDENDNDTQHSIPVPEIVPTTAEDRLTNILLQKLKNQGLVMPIPSVPSEIPTTVSGASTSSLSTPIAGSLPKTTTSSTVFGSLPTTTSNVPDVLSLDATQIFPLGTNINNQMLNFPNSPVDGVSLSTHISDKIRQDIWSNKYVEFSHLLPDFVPDRLSVSVLESEDEPVFKVSATPKPKQLTLDLE